MEAAYRSPAGPFKLPRRGHFFAAQSAKKRSPLRTDSLPFVSKIYWALQGEARQKDCRWSSGQPELVEDAFHCNLYGLVVRIDRCWVVRTAGWVERLSGGKEGFDGFVSEDDQRGHRPEAGRERLVAAGVADAANDLFAAEFLQIISGVAGAVLKWGSFARCAHLGGDLGGGEAVG